MCLGVGVVRRDQSSASLVLWAYVVPEGPCRTPSDGDRYKCMPFHPHLYRAIPGATPSDSLLGELGLQHLNDTGAFASVPDRHTSSGSSRFRLVYGGGMTTRIPARLSRSARGMVRSSGTQALVGTFLVEILPESGIIASDESFVCAGRQ